MRKPSAPPEPGRTLAYERLRRLLFLVPFVSRNQGLSVEQVAKAAGLSNAELIEDIEFLALVGRPPFQPDDFVEIYVEDEKVYVQFDQRLSAPPRLTAAEGVALAAAAELLRPAAHEALASALQKLEGVLPKQALQRYQEMSRQLDVSVEAPSGLDVLSQGIAEQCEVEFDYLTPKSDATERRRVRPYELFRHREQWYLSAFSLSRNEPRLFRVDRLSNAALTEVKFAPPTDDLHLSKLSVNPKNETSVRVRFAAAVGPSVIERFGAEAKTLADGRVEVHVPGDSERWLVQWVLSFGSEAEVVEPQWARDAVARVAGEFLR